MSPKKKLSGFDQNDVSEMRRYGVDLSHRWRQILEELASQTGFVPEWKLLHESDWWKSKKIGSVHCAGKIRRDGKETPAVLKIQGVKPKTSEALIIEAFEKQNRSKIIRPPKIYEYFPWDEKKQYEVFIFEKVEGRTAIVNRPAADSDLDYFFSLYKEYRTKCRNQLWIKKPQTWSYRKQMEEWRDAVKEHAESDKYKKPDDEKLVEKGAQLIESNLSVDDLEFVHGHFDQGDLITIKKGKVVLFANLMWGWRIPFYDAVFCYHWWMLGMEHANNLSEEMLELERRRWLRRIYSLPEIKGNTKNERLVTLALLERAIPALMVDRYYLDYSKPSGEIITRATRRELKRLIHELSS